MKKIKIQKDKFSWINFVGLFIAGVINATGVMLFLFPLKIYDSGISGLSMFLDQATPQFLTVSMFLILFDFPIFLLGLKKQGVTFTVYSLFAVAVYSGMAAIYTAFVLPKFPGVSPIASDDIFLCAIFGAILSGIGSGLTIRFGGGMDGIEVLAVMFHKKLNISIGTFVLIFNVILYIVAGVYFQSWILPLYSIVSYYIGSKTIDFVVDGISKSKCATIVTDKANEVCGALSTLFETSGTVVDAMGGYTKDKKQIVYVNVNQFQIYKLKKLIHQIDKNAYITIQDVSDIIKSKK